MLIKFYLNTIKACAILHSSANNILISLELVFSWFNKCLCGSTYGLEKKTNSTGEMKTICLKIKSRHERIQ